MPKEYYYNVTFDLDTSSVIYNDLVNDFYAEDLIGDEISAAEDEFLHDIIAKVEKNKHLTVDDFYNDFLWVRSDIEITEEDKARIIDIIENADYSDDGSSTAEIDTTSRWDWEESSVDVGFDYTINISASNVKINLEEVNESLDTNNFKLRESDEVNAMLDLMQNNDQFKDDPYVGSFWYDPDKDELFGIYSVLADREKFYKSKLFNQKVRTGTKLHKDIWRKEQFKKKDRRFNGDHTLVPRGRVFQLEDGSFKVMVGDWIDEYPQVKDEVLFEFQLPEDTEFVKDEHWNIGRGFSDEFLGEEYIVEKIIKKSDGYYVTSEDGEKNLGGPYKKKEDAEKRLGQVEFFKNKDKKKVNESLDFDTIFNSTGFEQDVINDMYFTSPNLPRKTIKLTYDYIRNNFDMIVEEIDDLESDGLSKRDIISILADDVYEKDDKNFKYYAMPVGEFIYRTIKYIKKNYLNESLKENSLDITDQVNAEYERLIKKFPNITRDELEDRLYSSVANILSGYNFVDGDKSMKIDKIVNNVLNKKKINERHRSELEEDVKDDEIKRLRGRLLQLNRAVEQGEDPERFAWEKEKIFNRLDELGANYYDESLKEEIEKFVKIDDDEIRNMADKLYTNGIITRNQLLFAALSEDEIRKLYKKWFKDNGKLRHKPKNESLNEAFPWEDEDSFFTREDLDEFTEELRDITDPMGDGGVTIYKAYFEPGNMLEVDWSYADYEETSKMKIDMRKIKLPSDLIKRYLYSFKFLIDRRVNEIVSELKESLKESKVIDVSELKPFKTIKAPNGTFWSFYKKDNKIYDDNGIEVTDDEIRSLGLTESLTEAAEEIKPIDLFRNAYKSGDYRDDDKMMEIYHQANEYFKKHPVKLEDVPSLVTLNDKYKEDVNIDVYYDDAETMWPSEFEPAYGAIEDYGFEYEIIPTNVNGVIMVMSSMGNDFTTMEDFKKYLTDENVFNYETQEQAAEFERDGLFTTESLTESDEVPTFSELYHTLISKIKGEGWTKKDCLKHLKSVGLSKEDTEEMLQELTSEGYLKAHSVSRRDPNALYVSKDTKDMVEEGDKLADGSNEYIVTMVWKGPRSSTITVRDAEDWSPIYNTPISSWYGTKLIKGPFIRRDGKLVKED